MSDPIMNQFVHVHVHQAGTLNLILVFGEMHQLFRCASTFYTVLHILFNFAQSCTFCTILHTLHFFSSRFCTICIILHILHNFALLHKFEHLHILHKLHNLDQYQDMLEKKFCSNITPSAGIGSHPCSMQNLQQAISQKMMSGFNF